MVFVSLNLEILHLHLRIINYCNFLQNYNIPNIDFKGTDSDAVVDEPSGRQRRQSMADLRKLAGLK